MIGIGCCARAASGHAAAAPSATSKSRRPMVTVVRPSRARVRKCNDATRRAHCPNSATPGAGGGHAGHRLQRIAAPTPREGGEERPTTRAISKSPPLRSAERQAASLPIVVAPT
jgi:hypothetical protein